MKDKMEHTSRWSKVGSLVGIPAPTALHWAKNYVEDNGLMWPLAQGSSLRPWEKGSYRIREKTGLPSVSRCDASNSARRYTSEKGLPWPLPLIKAP